MLDNHFFRNKHILIAGAGGIGKAVAETVTNLDATVSLLDVDKNALSNALLNLTGNRNKGYVCDFNDIKGIEPVIKQIIKEQGRMDGFVHCAGTGAVRPLKLSGYEFMLKVMNINFFSFIEIVRCITSKGSFNPEGMNIVGISALGAFIGNKAKTAYCSSKGAMIAAIRCMAIELSDKNIRVNAVAPGATDTPMAWETKNYTDSQGIENILSRQYLGLCDPIDISHAVIFLLGNMSRKITGTCLTVDGGKLSC